MNKSVASAALGAAVGILVFGAAPVAGAATTTTCTFSHGRTTCLTQSSYPERTYLGVDYVDDPFIEVAAQVGVDCEEGQVVRLFDPYFRHYVTVLTTKVYAGRTTKSRLIRSSTTRVRDEDEPVIFGTSFDCLPGRS